MENISLTIWIISILVSIGFGILIHIFMQHFYKKKEKVFGDLVIIDEDKSLGGTSIYLRLDEEIEDLKKEKRATFNVIPEK